MFQLYADKKAVLANSESPTAVQTLEDAPTVSDRLEVLPLSVQSLEVLPLSLVQSLEVLPPSSVPNFEGVPPASVELGPPKSPTAVQTLEDAPMVLDRLADFEVLPLSVQSLEVFTPSSVQSLEVLPPSSVPNFEGVPPASVELGPPAKKMKNECDVCRKPYSYLIPHLKKNPDCEQTYFDLHSVTSLTGLASVMKGEAQTIRRQNEKYRQDMNKKQKEQRQVKKVNLALAKKDYFSEISQILDTMCQGCKAFFNGKDLIQINPDHMLFTELDCDKSLDMVWICTNCLEIFDKIMMKKETLGDEWSRQISLLSEIQKIKKTYMGNHHPANVGVKMLITDAGRKTIFYPLVNSKSIVLDTVKLETGKRDLDVSVLLPQDIFEEELEESVNYQLEAEMASRQHDSPVRNLIGILYYDRLKKIQEMRKQKEKRNIEIRIGKKSNKFVSLVDTNPLEGCLRNLKGAKDYLEESRENTIFRQMQNGVNNVQFVWPVFGGEIETDELAMAHLHQMGYTFASKEITNEDGKVIKNFKTCCKGGITKCDPFNCAHQRAHYTPLKQFKDMKVPGNPTTICRFVDKQISIFVNKLIKPITTDYDVFVFFKRDGQILISGLLWFSALSLHAMQCDTVPDRGILPDLFKDDKTFTELFGENCVGVIQLNDRLLEYPVTLYEDSMIAQDTKDNVQYQELENCRECSLLEMVYCCSRDLKLQFPSQATVFINTQDPRKVCFSGHGILIHCTICFLHRFHNGSEKVLRILTMNPGSKTRMVIFGFK